MQEYIFNFCVCNIGLFKVDYTQYESLPYNHWKLTEWHSPVIKSHFYTFQLTLSLLNSRSFSCGTIYNLYKRILW